MTLGQRIQEHRTRLGLSQEGLGEKLGVSRQAVSRWEADGAVPDTDKLIALSKLFGITLNELLQVEDPPERGEQAEPAPRRRVLPAVLLIAALLVLTGTGVWLAGRVAALEKRAAALEGELAALRGEVTAPAYAPQAAGWSFRPGVWNSAGLSVRFTVTAARYDPEEDLQVYFLLDGAQLHAHRAEAERETGGVYAATVKLDPDLLRDFTLSAVFVRDGVEYAEPLARFDYLASGGGSWQPLLDEGA